MFDVLKTASKVFVALAIISGLLLIPVFAYLHDYQLEFDLNKHPVIAICIVGLLILQPIVFASLAVLTSKLNKALFAYDLNLHKK